MGDVPSFDMSMGNDPYKSHPYETEMGIGKSSLPASGPSCPPCQVSSRLVVQPALEEPDTGLRESEDNKFDRENMSNLDPDYESEGDPNEKATQYSIFGASPSYKIYYILDSLPFVQTRATMYDFGRQFFLISGRCFRLVWCTVPSRGSFPSFVRWVR
jgi:hypothetical protein